MTTSTRLESAGWERTEPGWWTHESCGGIVREGSGRWSAWPLEGVSIGIFDSALNAAEQLRKNPKPKKP